MRLCKLWLQLNDRKRIPRFKMILAKPIPSVTVATRFAIESSIYAIGRFLFEKSEYNSSI